MGKSVILKLMKANKIMVSGVYNIQHKAITMGGVNQMTNEKMTLFFQTWRSRNHEITLNKTQQIYIKNG